MELSHWIKQQQILQYNYAKELVNMVNKPQSLRKADLEDAINDELSAWELLNKALPQSSQVESPIQKCLDTNKQPYYQEIEQSIRERHKKFEVVEFILQMIRSGYSLEYIVLKLKSRPMTDDEFYWSRETAIEFYQLNENKENPKNSPMKSNNKKRYQPDDYNSVFKRIIQEHAEYYSDYVEGKRTLNPQPVLWPGERREMTLGEKYAALRQKVAEIKRESEAYHRESKRMSRKVKDYSDIPDPLPPDPRLAPPSGAGDMGTFDFLTDPDRHWFWKYCLPYVSSSIIGYIVTHLIK